MIGMRIAGAAAKSILTQAAVDAWQVPVEELQTKNSHVHHAPSNRSAPYAAFAAQAAEVISLIEPQIVVPMHYKTPQTTLKLDEVDKFLKVMGISKVQHKETLRISSGLTDEQTQVVILEVQQ